MKYIVILLILSSCNPWKYRGVEDCDYVLPSPWKLYYNPNTKEYSLGWKAETYPYDRFLGCDNEWAIYTKNEEEEFMEIFSDSCSAKGFFKEWLTDESRWDANYDFKPLH